MLKVYFGVHKTFRVKAWVKTCFGVMKVILKFETFIKYSVDLDEKQKKVLIDFNTNFETYTKHYENIVVSC